MEIKFIEMIWEQRKRYFKKFEGIKKKEQFENQVNEKLEFIEEKLV